MPIAELPQTNKMHAVPQNIMDVEFKLVGDLTMRQFTYLIVFEGLAYFMSVIIIGLFKLPLVVIFAILGFALAFVPIQERGLDEWIANFLRAVYSPSQRIWRKEPTIPSAFLYENINVVKQELIALAPTSSRRKLEEYLHYQAADKVIDPLDIPEAEYAKKVRDAFANTVAEPSTQISQAPYAGVGVSLEPEIETEIPFYQPESSGGQEPSEEGGQAEKQAEQGEMKEKEEGGQTNQQVQVQAQTQPNEHAEYNEPIIKQQRRPNTKDTMMFAPITPDMHAGRKFTNLLPAGGEIVLPIRGEKVLITMEEQDIEEDVREKAEKLKLLLAQIKRSGVVNIPLTQEKANAKAEQIALEEERVSSEAEAVIEKLKSEKDSISEELEKLKSEPVSSGDQKAMSEKEQRIHVLESQKERTQADYAKLEQQILDLQNKLKQKEEVTGIPIGSTATKPVYARIQPISITPNVVTGIVKKPDGGILEGVLLIIKNDKGEAVRAFKTNGLGQFSLTTALANGLYTLEVSDDKGADLSFGIISVEAKGEAIPPIEVTGKVKQ